MPARDEAKPQSVQSSLGVLTKATLGLVAKGRMRLTRQLTEGRALRYNVYS